MVSNRLRKNRDFQEVYSRGRKVFGRYVVLFFQSNCTGMNRYGLVASKKMGKAVARNRWKRQAREIVMALNKGMKQGYDVVIVARLLAKEASFIEIERDMNAVFKKARLFL